MDPHDMSYQSFRSEMWAQRVQFAMPRRVVKPKWQFHERMCEHWLEQARGCGRPEYWESPGFADDRRDRWGDGSAWRRKVHGHEKPYGPFSRRTGATSASRCARRG
jgi:hypothetical protein